MPQIKPSTYIVRIWCGICHIGIAALVLVAAVVGPVVAAVCVSRDELVAKLERKHAEYPAVMALTSHNKVLEVYVSVDGGWTIMVTGAYGPACVVYVGEAWVVYPVPDPNVEG